MGRYDEVWSEDQRRAIGSFLLEPDPITGKRRTVPQCKKALMAGRLSCAVPPKPPPDSTFYYFKRREEQRRSGETLSPLAKQALEDPETVRTTFIQQAVSAHEYVADRVQTAHQKGKLDPRLYGMFVKNTPTVCALLKAYSQQAKSKPKPSVMESDREDTPQPDDALSKLVEAHESESRGVAA